MNITKEEVQQVLDALIMSIEDVKECQKNTPEMFWSTVKIFKEQIELHNAAISLLQSKLAEEDDGGPVAFLFQHCETGRTRVVMRDDVMDASATWFKVGAMYLHPAKQTPMTDEEIDKVWHSVAWHSSKGLVELRRDYACGIEKHHGITS